MAATLPEQPSVTVTQTPRKLTRSHLDRLEHLLIVVPEDFGPGQWRPLPFGQLLARLATRARDKKSVPLVTTRLPTRAHTSVSVARVAASASPFERLTKARKLVADAMRQNPAGIGVLAPGYEAATARQMIEALHAAIIAAGFSMPSYKSTPLPARRLRRLQVFGLPERMPLERSRAEGEGNNLARWLTALPPNELYPDTYRERVAALAQQAGWQMRFLDERALNRLGAGAFLAVARGNNRRGSGIVRLRYRPTKGRRGQPLVALVGKGICFDTGGTNLKPFKSMLDMQHDMQGSAVALGVLLALTRLQVSFPVDCWLAITENRIGPDAYASRDVVTAANGTTIEVIHTDAEGRMVLADALALAARDEPALVIDYATLTGACIVSLTDRYSGVFTNRPTLQETLVAAGRDSGERTWPFPLDDDYDEDLESQIADVLQCGIRNDGDHILAARFLSRFVPQAIPWVHLDLAAGHHKGGLGHVATDITGFGVRYTLNLLLDRRLHERAGPHIS